MAKVRKFKLTSGGVAYNLEIGFVPETVTVWNATKWETDGTKVLFFWHRGMADAYSLSEVADDTAINRVIDTTNGFTPYASSSVNDAQEVISGATQANPCVLTVVSSSGWAVNDTVRIRSIAGMTELNGNIYKIKAIGDSTHVTLDVDASGFSAYTSAGVVYNLSVNVVDSGFTGITLGTTVMGADSDVLHIEAVGADEFTDLGDIG